MLTKTQKKNRFLLQKAHYQQRQEWQIQGNEKMEERLVLSIHLQSRTTIEHQEDKKDCKRNTQFRHRQ